MSELARQTKECAGEHSKEGKACLSPLAGEQKIYSNPARVFVFILEKRVLSRVCDLYLNNFILGTLRNPSSLKENSELHYSSL